VGLDDPAELSARAWRLLPDGANHLFGVSAISLWEIAAKVASGKLHLSQPVPDWLGAAVRPPFVAVLRLTHAWPSNPPDRPALFTRTRPTG
jgi:PIN domain nuclease of toxin-antitoxin system